MRTLGSCSPQTLLTHLPHFHPGIHHPFRTPSSTKLASLAIPGMKVGAAMGPQGFSPCGFGLSIRHPALCHPPVLSCLTPTQTESDLQCQIPCRLWVWIVRGICCSQERKRADQIEFLFSDPIRCTQLLRAAFLREAWLSMDGTSKMPFVLLAMPWWMFPSQTYLCSISPMSFWDLNSRACQLKLLHEGGPGSLDHPGVLVILGCRQS